MRTWCSVQTVDFCSSIPSLSLAYKMTKQAQTSKDSSLANCRPNKSGVFMMHTIFMQQGVRKEGGNIDGIRKTRSHSYVFEQHDTQVKVKVYTDCETNC